MASDLPFQIRLLGELQVLRQSAPVELPRSRKTRALLAYLVAIGRAQRRERLANLLWDAGDDRRASLRWSLSRLRALVDDATAQRIVVAGDALEFRPEGAFIDVVAVGQALGKGLDGLGTGELTALAALFRGPFLEGLDQPECHEFQSWCVAERERWRLAQKRVLGALLERHAAQPAAALAHARELVHLAPEDAASWRALIGVLWAAGSPTEAEEQFRIALRRLESSGPVALQEIRSAYRELSMRAPPAPEVAPLASGASAPPVAPARQRVQFCRASDGVRIAYASVGTGPPLVKTANWMSHLEYDWKSPIWRHLASELSRHYTLVRYDQRGNGLSDWAVESFSFDAFVSDLEAVVEAAGLTRFPLLGVSQGCAVAVEYAVRHPERVEKLVLLAGFARGGLRRSAEERQARDAMQTLIRVGWGSDNPAFRQLFSSLFMPGASPEQFREFNELQRVSCSAENAARICASLGEIDIVPRLSEVRAPTLVLHSTEDARIPFDAGRALAAGIPGARFVALDSKNHLLLSHEPAWQRFLSEVQAFLAEA